MPKRYRLTGEEMKHISGKRVHGALFSMVVSSLEGNSPKCACVVSKKVAARAVDRNTIKRRTRAALSKLVPAMPDPVALVFYAKREVLSAPMSAVRADIEALMRRARS